MGGVVFNILMSRSWGLLQLCVRAVKFTPQRLQNQVRFRQWHGRHIHQPRELTHRSCYNQPCDLLSRDDSSKPFIGWERRADKLTRSNNHPMTIQERRIDPDCDTSEKCYDTTPISSRSYSCKTQPLAGSKSSILSASQYSSHLHRDTFAKHLGQGCPQKKTATKTIGDQFLSNASAGSTCSLLIMVKNPRPVLDQNPAPIGPETLSRSGAGVWRKVPVPRFRSVLDWFWSAAADVLFSVSAGPLWACACSCSSCSSGVAECPCQVPLVLCLQCSVSSLFSFMVFLTVMRFLWLCLSLHWVASFWSGLPPFAVSLPSFSSGRVFHGSLYNSFLAIYSAWSSF